jgi:hypothetical protein
MNTIDNLTNIDLDQGNTIAYHSYEWSKGKSRHSIHRRTRRTNPSRYKYSPRNRWGNRLHRKTDQQRHSRKA